MPDSSTPGTGSERATDVDPAQALFAGLVYSEDGEQARVVMIGGVAHYAIPDHGFMRHVEAAQVDDAAIHAMQDQMAGMRDELIAGMLQAMGTDDILAKAALEASIDNMGATLRRSDSSQWAPMLRLYGFRIVVDVHGALREIIYPRTETDDDADEDGPGA